MITNTVNDKKYVGITTRKNGFKGRYPSAGKGIERVYAHMNRLIKDNQSYNKHLYRSICKYGFEKFKVDEIFDKALNKECLLEKERYWIQTFNTTDSNYGYNHTSGGEGLSGCTRTFDTRVRMREAKGKSLKEEMDYWMLIRKEWDNPFAYIWDINDGLNTYQKTVLVERLAGGKSKNCRICDTPLLNKEVKPLCKQCEKPEFLSEYRRNRVYRPY